MLKYYQRFDNIFEKKKILYFLSNLLFAKSINLLSYKRLKNEICSAIYSLDFILETNLNHIFEKC